MFKMASSVSTKHLKTLKTFSFGSSVQVFIPEVLDGNYGMYVWPCATVLAQYLWYQRMLIKEKTILEIGAGTSLPGITAAKCGANIILSDSSDYPQCLENCRQSCKANNLSNIPVIGLTWGMFTPELINLQPVDIILGSDCFFDTHDFEDIIVTVAYIMEKRKDTEFWCTYQERSDELTNRECCVITIVTRVSSPDLTNGVPKLQKYPTCSEKM